MLINVIFIFIALHTHLSEGMSVDITAGGSVIGDNSVSEVQMPAKVTSKRNPQKIDMMWANPVGVATLSENLSKPYVYITA